MEELSEKQRRFCEEYVVDYNGARAARAAGYSEKTARSIASENLTKPNIQSYIQYLKDNISMTTGVTAIRNVFALKKIAYSSIGGLKKNWKEFKDWEDLTEEQKAAIAEISHTEISIGEEAIKSTVKLKMHDPMKALQELNKMFGFYELDKKGKSASVKSVYIEFGDQEDDLPETEDDIEDVELD